MRGARTGDNPAPHLLAAPGRAAGTVLTQRRVADESNEIPALPDLLAPLDLDGAVAGADATAHPDRHRRVDPQSRRPLRAHREEQPARPETGAGEAALEGRPGRLERRHRSRRAGAAHRPGRGGSRPGRLPRRRPGDPDPPHQNRQGEEAHRGGPPGSAPSPRPTPGPSRSPPGPEGTGPWRTASTGCETSSRARTATSYASATHLWSRPH